MGRSGCDPEAVIRPQIDLLLNFHVWFPSRLIRCLDWEMQRLNVLQQLITGFFYQVQDQLKALFTAVIGIWYRLVIGSGVLQQ
jgi:hypothetical protein